MLALRNRQIALKSMTIGALLCCIGMSTLAQQKTPDHADRLYSQAKWREAAAAYKAFADENPDYIYLTRIYMRIGQSYAELEGSGSRAAGVCKGG